jgi:Fur family transcriptional regulator, zinc uptake regulator
MTSLRQGILALLQKHDRAISAYELASLYEQAVQRPVRANSIYRALEYLEQHGLVAHLTSQRRYVATAPPSVHGKATVFLVCTACGRTSERNEPKLGRALHEAANAVGFAASTRVLEIDGLCSDCQSKASKKTQPAPDA